MIITDEIYNDLLKQIEAGEFLRNTSLPIGLPSLPTDASDGMRRHQEQCQQTLDLYLTKMNAMEAQMEGLKEILKEKEAIDRANLYVKNFDEKLGQQFEDYRAASEETTARLKADLQLMKDQVANVIEQNQELKKENLNLVNKTNKLTLEKKKQEDKMREMQNVLTSKETEALAMAEMDNKMTNNLLAKKEAEIEKLRKAALKKDKDMVKMARESIGYCIAVLIDIDNEQYEKREEAWSAAQGILTKLVKHGFVNFLDQTEISRLVMAITDIPEKREDANKERLQKERQQKEDSQQNALTGKIAEQVNISMGGQSNAYNQEADGRLEILGKLLNNNQAEDKA